MSKKEELEVILNKIFPLLEADIHVLKNYLINRIIQSYHIEELDKKVVNKLAQEYQPQENEL